MNFLEILFILSAMMTCLCALAVLFTKNIMHSCIFLLGSLLGVAGLYLSLGADFVAATQILVYVGGIVILMLFAVMLTGGQDFILKKVLHSGLSPVMGSGKTYFKGIIVVFLFALPLFTYILNISKGQAVFVEQPFTNTSSKLGELLITDHVLSFEIVSVLLLGALIGAATIARPNRKYSKGKN